MDAEIRCAPPSFHLRPLFENGEKDKMDGQDWKEFADQMAQVDVVQQHRSALQFEWVSLK